MASTVVPDEHEYDAEGICTRCGRSRGFADSFGVGCGAGGAESPPQNRRLVRPLAIVSHGSEASETLEARLVSGGDAEIVVATVAGRPGEFDPDAAFRKLDDLRTRAETVYQWVAEGLAEIPDPPASPDPAAEAPAGPPGRSALGILVRVLPLVLATGAGIAFVLDMGAGTVVTIAAWVGGIVAVFLIAGASGAGGAATFATVVALCGLLVAVGLAEVEVGVSRAFLSVVLVLIAALVAAVIASPPAPPTPPRSPREFVVRAGEATRYVPGLFVVGPRRKLCVVIECKAEDGSTVRRVTLPLDGATRESAAAAVHRAKAPDLALAAERARESAEDEVAAEALERLAELERSRRSLPE